MGCHAYTVFAAEIQDNRPPPQMLVPWTTAIGTSQNAHVLHVNHGHCLLETSIYYCVSTPSQIQQGRVWLRAPRIQKDDTRGPAQRQVSFQIRVKLTCDPLLKFLERHLSCS